MMAILFERALAALEDSLASLNCSTTSCDLAVVANASAATSATFESHMFSLPLQLGDYMKFSRIDQQTL